MHIDFSFTKLPKLLLEAIFLEEIYGGIDELDIKYGLLKKFFSIRIFKDSKEAWEPCRTVFLC